MAKNAVCPIYWFFVFGVNSVKKWSLFFDSIYYRDLNTALQTGYLNSYAHEVDFLVSAGLLKDYSEDFDSNISEETKIIRNKQESIWKNFQSGFNPNQKENSKLLRQFEHLAIRHDGIGLSKKYGAEFYPILNSLEAVQNQDIKSDIVSFVLQKIPEPNENTPWEHILEFRSDADVKNKYLALIDWINTISKSSLSPNEIKEKYEYLYSDYLKYFKLHKMKYNNSMLEVIITLGAGALLGLQSGQFIMPFGNLLKMKLSHINLLQEEAKLPGKEIAYIYKAQEEFGQFD